MLNSIVFVKTVRKFFLGFVFLCLSILVSGCAAKHHINDSLIKHVSGDFRIGGFLGVSYAVKITNNELAYRTSKRGVINDWQKQQLSAADISKLESKFVELNVVNWDKQYIDPRVMDGTQWSVSYSSKKIHIKSNGSNKYPENYTALTNYISKELLQGKPFN